MVAVPGFHDRIEFGEFQRDVVKHSLMVDFHDVAAGLADFGGDLGEDAWLIVDRHARPRDMSRPGHAAHQRRGPYPGVDIGAADQQADGRAGEPAAVFEQRRQRRRAGAFGQNLGLQQHGLHRRLDGRFGHDDNIVDQPPDDFQRDVAGRFDGDALGDAGATQGRLDPVQGVIHRGIQIRLDADNIDFRRDRLGRGGDAGNEPAAADGNDDRVESRDVVQDFESRGSLPGDNFLVVIGMDENQPVARRAFQGEGLDGVDAVAPQFDPRAKRLGAADLGEGGAFGHHDGRRNAEPLGVIGDALRMVAGGHRDHAALFFVRGQAVELDQRAAILEGSGALQGFELEIDIGVEQIGKRTGPDCRRADDIARDEIGGAANIVDRNAHDSPCLRVAGRECRAYA